MIIRSDFENPELINQDCEIRKPGNVGFKIFFF
jgi:hypothetical protein